MTINLGTGPVLKDACPWLRDDAERHEQILRVTECNSFIEATFSGGDSPSPTGTAFHYRFFALDNAKRITSVTG